MVTGDGVLNFILRRKRVALGIAALLTLVVGVADYSTGREVILSVYYMFPSSLPRGRAVTFGASHSR